MALTGRELMNYMEELAPLKYAEEWDNVGFLIGDPDRRIEKILVALDATPQVVEEGIVNQVDLIVTHHPFPFRGFKSVRRDQVEGKLIFSMIENHISLYAAHTNLDIAFGGTNDVLADEIGLESVDILSPLSMEEKGERKDSGVHKREILGMGRIGKLSEPMVLKKYSNHVRKSLGLTYVRVVGNVNQKIQKVAICTGSGMSYLWEGIRQGADVFITGDVKFHEAQEALQQGIAIIDAGHYGTEHLIVPALAKSLKEWTQGKIMILESKVERDPFQLIQE